MFMQVSAILLAGSILGSSAGEMQVRVTSLGLFLVAINIQCLTSRRATAATGTSAAPTARSAVAENHMAARVLR